jgi:hypothetical protein
MLLDGFIIIILFCFISGKYTERNNQGEEPGFSDTESYLMFNVSLSFESCVGLLKLKLDIDLGHRDVTGSDLAFKKLSRKLYEATAFNWMRKPGLRFLRDKKGREGITVSLTLSLKAETRRAPV